MNEREEAVVTLDPFAIQSHTPEWGMRSSQRRISRHLEGSIRILLQEIPGGMDDLATNPRPVEKTLQFRP